LPGRAPARYDLLAGRRTGSAAGGCKRPRRRRGTRDRILPMDTLQALLAGGALPLVALAVAFAFEAVNGFHDTANAVATVIYTHSLRPGTAILLSGVCNALGVLAGGTAVAFSVVHLLPVDVLVNSESGAAVSMVLALLFGAMVWNVG